MIQTVSLHIPAYGNRPFAIQDALGPRSYWLSLLISTGCAAEHDNCTSACLRHDLVFGDAATLANCIAYEKIADSLAAGHLTANARKIADRYSIGSSQKTVTAINESIHSCLRAHCQTDSKCREFNRTRVSSVQHGLELPFNHVSLGILCDSITAPIVGDISGIGVPRVTYHVLWI